MFNFVELIKSLIIFDKFFCCKEFKLYKVILDCERNWYFLVIVIGNYFLG